MRGMVVDLVNGQSGLRRLIDWVQALEWRLHWDHILEDLTQMHQRMGLAVLGQTEPEGCWIIHGMILCNEEVAISWDKDQYLRLGTSHVPGAWMCLPSTTGP